MEEPPAAPAAPVAVPAGEAGEPLMALAWSIASERCMPPDVPPPTRDGGGV
jgi:hypothetical protein